LKNQFQTFPGTDEQKMLQLLLLLDF